MAISKLGGGTSDNWELISSVTPTAASAAVNFTGLSPYKKLLLVWNGLVLNASSTLSIRLNNDSSAAYSYFWTDDKDAVGNQAYDINFNFFDTSIFIAGAGTSQKGILEFGNCDMTGLKTIVNGGNAQSGGESIGYWGYYFGTSVISQVNLITASTFTAVGIVSLYGVK